ncbi:MAG: protein-glutamate O-methyltransferase CheR [Winogradskyella sp.]|uniref:CheR family methyltransferase n=1 Tax=Winogradskyella sp. TaxID=1883156 RepID=UPI0025F560A1|nr:protein-glutamate O-methyltransferase CheR [Winogradskyella sp.]NRB61040.1 protein-glutamate O-methyltransferase CheR [Winogradskyella sp.]
MTITSLSDTDLEQMISISKHIFDFDFSGYAPESLKRRMLRLIEKWGFSSIYEFQYAITNGELSRETLLNEITVNVTDMFRDPKVFYKITKVVFPYLESFPEFKVWHAGCSSGQEMYSLAILLKEHGLLKKTLQYGTDINTEVLKTAESGIYSISEMRKYSANYLSSGGQFSLSDYYTAKYQLAKMNSELKKKMVFSSHNLVKNPSFNEFQLIMCRNVLIYFDRDLQNKVLSLLIDSLAPYGYLVLGDKETISFYKNKEQLELVDKQYKIYRKKAIISD